MTKRYRKKITVVLSLVLPVILLFAILNCFTTYVFYEDYKNKMNLMTEIAATEEFSGLDVVSELLKDKDIETNEQGCGGKCCGRFGMVVKRNVRFGAESSCRRNAVSKG